LDPDSKTKSALVVIDNLTMAIFTIEIISKIVSYGFLLNGEYSYMRELWNIMDFIILALSYVCFLP
jgi:Ion transport protein